MRSANPWMAAALVAGLLSACSKTTTEPASLSPVGNYANGALGLPDPEHNGDHVGRSPRRITVAQLGTSILTATGQPWTQLQTLAPSLGAADFALVVSESDVPNLVFAKFLEDGARQVCQATVAADLAQSTAAARVLAPYLPDSLSNLTAIPEPAIRSNLVYLSTRFWGEPLSGGDLDKWTGLFKQLAARSQQLGQPAQALSALCIALMTDSRFLTY